MRRRLQVLMAVAAIALAGASFALDAKGWEPVRADVSQLNSVARSNDVEIKVSPGQVVVASTQQIRIKIFTILGQVVSDDSLPAGVNRLTLPHGIYIIKVADLTCKVAV
ncbi:MAG: T9SS type A sorting domain-containing protein [Bacteroidales bacterium]|nr:T9SS type A sorting domain-containing protein [Bacteroidales bacterium]